MPPFLNVKTVRGKKYPCIIDIIDLVLFFLFAAVIFMHAIVAVIIQDVILCGW